MNIRSKNSPINRLLGWAMYGFAFIMPLTNLPQIIQLFQTHVASGLSLQTWVLYLVFGLIPLFYGISNNIKPLIVTNILWTIIDLVMIVGILRFGTFGNSTYDQLLLINNIGKALAGIGFICLSSAAALFANDLLYIKRSKNA